LKRKSFFNDLYNLINLYSDAAEEMFTVVLVKMFIKHGLIYKQRMGIKKVFINFFTKCSVKKFITGRMDIIPV